MADAAAGRRQAPDLVGIRVHHVREPDVVTAPAQAFDIGDRPLTELAFAEAVFVEGLGEMGVQAHAVVAAREFGALAHQLRGHAERRAGRKTDAQHRVTRRVVEAGDDPRAVGEHRVLVLAQAVRRQPAFTLPEAHAAAGRVETHAELARGADLVVEPRAVREQVQVIGDRGRAGQQ